jgi:hypothetical protein
MEALSSPINFVIPVSSEDLLLESEEHFWVRNEANVEALSEKSLLKLLDGTRFV